MDCEVLKNNAEKYINPIIIEFGYEVVEVKCETINKQKTLTFFVYSPNGITLEDCIKINDILVDPLEALDISKGDDYVLNISSPGLDRLIVSDDDYRRNVNTKVDVTMKHRKNRIVGIIQEYDSLSVTILTTQGKIEKIERQEIQTILPHIEF